MSVKARACYAFRLVLRTFGYITLAGRFCPQTLCSGYLRNEYRHLNPNANSLSGVSSSTAASHFREIRELGRSNIKEFE
jgi:hypothetical protein